jgi:hypothetical protein
MEIGGATNVFITKCTFYNSTDELCSIRSGSDKVTISWCKFYFTTKLDHAFAHLIGHNDNNAAQDQDKLNCTFHHNWYSTGIIERMPRVRFGKVHVYNNLFESDRTNYVIGVGINSSILVEGCYFKDQGENIFYDWRAGKAGVAQCTDNNSFIGTSKVTPWATTDVAFKPPYDYSLTKTEDVPALVRANAGNVIGTVSVHDVRLDATPEKRTPVNITNFSSTTPEVVFNLDQISHVHITIHDNLGRKVITVLNQTMPEGHQTVNFSRSTLSNGVYYLKYQTNSVSQVLMVYNK